MSMPKWNLAWWKKDSADPSMRHDELTPPSATISPSKSLAATTPDANRPIRTPYQTEQSNTPATAQTNEPPTPRSFALSNVTPDPKSAPPALPNMPNIGNPSSPEGIANRASANIGSVVPSGQSTSSIPNSYNAASPDPSSTAMPVQAHVPDAQLPIVVPQSQPARYTNPYVAKSGEATQPPAAEAGAAAPQVAPSASNDSVYARTPHNAFTPKNAPVSLNGSSPLRPLSQPAPNSAPSGDSETAAANDVAVSSSEIVPTPPAGNQIAEPKAETPTMSMPPATNGYAPGSIRSAQALPELRVNLPTTEIRTAPQQPVVPTATPPAAPLSTGSTSIGGGGSFQLGK
jgi:hypothetical protein